MGEVDRAKHEMEELKGEAKEKLGDVTDDHSLQAEGLIDRAKAKLGQFGDDVRDKIRGRKDRDEEKHS